MNTGQLPDPSDYTDDRELRDDESIANYWLANLCVQDLLQIANQTVNDADYEVTKDDSISKEDVANAEIDIREAILTFIERIEMEVEPRPPKLPDFVEIRDGKTRLVLTHSQMQRLYVDPVRQELQAALDAAVKDVERLNALVGIGSDTHT